MTKTATKPLAKSLHTVTVLVRLSRFLMESWHLTPRTALDDAMNVLKLNHQPDTYELRAAALKQLEA